MSNTTAQVLMKKGKRGAAAYIHADCAGGSPQHLGPLLDVLLNPSKAIDEWETIDWCRWLLAGGRTPDEFAAIVRSYDKHDKCGLVWIPRVVAYRCRTCGISPCMSICRECFHRGDHSTHDFNMFLSQAGGACDCGDNSVMKEDGFCSNHGNKCPRPGTAPAELMCVAEAMMPRLVLRLLQHFRENSTLTSSDNYRVAIQECEGYVQMLMEFNNMGDLMRGAMTKALINPQMYRNLVEPPFPDTEYGHYMCESHNMYEKAIESFPAPEPPDEYRDLPALAPRLTHNTLLDEFLFWTFKYEFPQNVVCFLLNMLPDQDYKEHLTRTFVLHYARMPLVLEGSSDPETLSNRVVHMSVQLFSNEALALRCVRELRLLHVMVLSLQLMMGKILVRHTLHDPARNRHRVIDCTRRVMKEHCYWPLVSDFNNVLSHRSVALLFLADEALVDMWFEFLAMLQGMNVNVRETGGHIEFEPSSYYAAFSCELEAAAYPMWSVLAHLSEPAQGGLARGVVCAALRRLRAWLRAVGYDPAPTPALAPPPPAHASFHFPLHRYLAAFLCAATRSLGLRAADLLPPPRALIALAYHPLRVQSLFYEILAGVWVRNGLQIKGQAMTYIQANFCNSMVDLDVYWLQVCAAHLPADSFLDMCIDVFGVREWLSLTPLSLVQAAEQDAMVEGLLTFLAILVSSRTNLGNDELTQSRLEVATLLAAGDKTHSQLLELMPERSGNAHTRNFEQVLKELSVYRAPPRGSEALEQGLFVPRPVVWQRYYDPLHVLRRAVHRRDFHSSMDRFTQYVREKRKAEGGSVGGACGAGETEAGAALWPPLRPAPPPPPAAGDPRQLCASGVLHGALLAVLARGVRRRGGAEGEGGAPPDHVLALAVYLLAVAADLAAERAADQREVCLVGGEGVESVGGVPLLRAFPGGSVCDNARTLVTHVPPPRRAPANSPAPRPPSDSEPEWETSESEMGPPSGMGGASSALAVPHEMGGASTALAVPHDLSGASTALAVAHDLSGASTALAMQDLSGASTALAVQDLSEASTALAVPPPLELVRGNSMSDQSDAGDETEIRALESDINELQALVLLQHSLRPTDGAPAPDHQMSLALPSSPHHFTPEEEWSVMVGDESPPPALPAPQPHAAHDTQVQVHSTSGEQIAVNESIISLLLKLHSQLSGRLDSFALEEPAPASQEPIGDGPFFIAKLLHKLAALDARCAAAVSHVRRSLWPHQRERQAEQRARERREKEERSRRARERQAQLMREFARRQAQFLSTLDGEGAHAMDWDDGPPERDYDCVICNTTAPTASHDPIGLVVLLQSTSVLAHRRRTSDPVRLPLAEPERARLAALQQATAGAAHDRLLEELGAHWERDAALLAAGAGWEGGVAAQSCGHHLHLRCLRAYLRSLAAPQRPHNLHVERGEFLCPLCRQLANSVLPLAPRPPAPPVPPPAADHARLAAQVFEMLQRDRPAPSPSRLSEAMGKAMEDMTATAGGKLKQRYGSSPAAIFTFVSSLVRTNLECELVQRSGHLCAAPAPRYKPRDDCIVPLMAVAGAHAMALAAAGARDALGAAAAWRALVPSAAPVPPPAPSAPPVPSPPAPRAVPLLLRDPTTLLIHLLLLAPPDPPHLDPKHFRCIVWALYALTYYQVVNQLVACGRFRGVLASPGAGSGEGEGLAGAARLLLAALAPDHLLDDDPPADMDDDDAVPPADLDTLELEVQELTLPFLRISALLKKHLYGCELPHIESEREEWSALRQFLELGGEGGSLPPGAATAARGWARQLAGAAAGGTLAVARVLRSLHAAWRPPALLALPREYDRLFTYYHERVCLQCGAVPKEASVCLLCGTLVCLKAACCRQRQVAEAVAHAAECGGGTGIFLVVTSTYIIVIRGRRACLWGSLYLDSYDEEDRDLKRGKPLFLSRDRTELLQAQWLAHRFDHTKRTWVWHRDSL
ncbi:E3 ubiquitin-protein ligase Ubr3 [Aricia agestis]|uniref:E3 ubiquitin-protein ligase Ubr3 n=1 Tax=Aricia agestis TaxID=91739 RepID=UPI001C20B79A|nr:E3 ubiquitin-protein ligase Ubr3 [Aricia agestis]